MLKKCTFTTNGISEYPNLSITFVSEKAGASRYNTNEKFDTILRNTAPITRSWQLSKVVICKLIETYMYRHFVALCYAQVTRNLRKNKPLARLPLLLFSRTWPISINYFGSDGALMIRFPLFAVLYRLYRL